MSADQVDAERVRVLVSRMKDWMLRHGASNGLWTLAERDMLTEAAKVIAAPPVDAERVREDLRETTHLLRCLVAGSIERDSEQIDAVAEEAERWLKRRNALTPTPAVPCMLADCEGTDGDIPPHPYHPPEQPASSPDAATEDEWGVRRFRSAQRVRAFLTDSPDAATGGEAKPCAFHAKGGNPTHPCELELCCPAGTHSIPANCTATCHATPAPSKPSGDEDPSLLAEPRVGYAKPSAPAPEGAENAKAAELRRLVDLGFPPGTTATALASDVQKALSAATAENARLREELGRWQRRVEVEKKNLDAEHGRGFALSREIDALRAKLSASETRCAGLQREHDLTARVATEQRQRAEELAAKLAEAEYDLGKANKAITLYKQSCAERKQRADAAEAKADDALKWIRVVGEEMVIAGYSGGDRSVTLGNIRTCIQQRDAAEARAKELERLFADEKEAAVRHATQYVDTERRIGEAVEAIKSLTPEGHYGSDPDNAPCDETCAHENGEGAEQHRPDIGDDRCDREDECYRCIALNALESLTPPGEKDNNSSNHGGSTR